MRKKGSVLVIVVIIVLITIFVGIGILIISTPTVKGLSQCLENENKYLEDENINLVQSFQKGITKKRTEREACFQLKQSTERLLSCYESVERESILPLSVPFTIVTLFKKSHGDMSPQSLIKLHNSECGQYPESKILE